MLQELRLYTVPPGRLGDHHVRHNGKLATICQSHGIDIVGRWSALVGQGTPMFAYMMRYSGFAEREAQWGQLLPGPGLVEISRRDERRF